MLNNVMIIIPINMYIKMKIYVNIISLYNNSYIFLNVFGLILFLFFISITGLAQA
jgi:hypothetical protein